MTGVAIPREAWQAESLPRHLRMTFRVVDGNGVKLSESTDLEELKRNLTPALRAEISIAGHDVERSGLRSWDFDPLPEVFEQQHDGHPVKAYPALVDEGDSVGVRVFPTEREQRRESWLGARRLLLLNAPSPVKSIQRGLSNRAKLVLAAAPHGDVVRVLDDCVSCAADKIMADHGGPARDSAGFAALSERVRENLDGLTRETVSRVERVLFASQRADAALTDRRIPADARADVEDQLADLVYPGFVTATGWQRLPDLARYLNAVEHRLQRLPENPLRDREWMDRVADLQQRYRGLAGQEDQEQRDDLRQIGWMIEELRVSYFAQRLGTAYPVSEKRIHRALDQWATIASTPVRS
jgi:ATP-dependent helicase HrpA